MHFQRFEVKNYKGIKHCILNLEKAKPQVLALVGLNESGKTTLLEAINHFVAGDRELQRVYGIETVGLDKSTFIPKNKQLNFNDNITIKAWLELNSDDLKVLIKAFESQGYTYAPGLNRISMTATQIFKYSESNYQGSSRTWQAIARVKKKGGSKLELVDSKHPCWNTYVDTTSSLMPQICYFPTFLFDVPDKIYIEDHVDEDPVNAYYRKLIQDVLDSLGQGISLQTHVIDRVRGSDGKGTWAKFVDSNKREQVNHVLASASDKITKVIIASWKRVFNVDFEGKRVDLEYGLDAETELITVKISLVDPPERYRIRDRSLGFQWFFCFWLFTYFRTLRSNKTGIVFLLDEPASNLHARAQEEILKSLEGLAEKENVVIYSTHSHYLINPAWLDRATIVSNGLPLKGDILDEFAIKSELDIRAVSYRTFVGGHPNQRTYYLPILDSLDYRPSELTLTRPSMIVEGKADYAFLMSAYRDLELPFAIIPGGGATTMSPIASILIGWGLPVVCLLDDDKAGRDAAKNYIASGLVEATKVKTIGDLDIGVAGHSLESLLLIEYADEVKAHFSVDDANKPLLQKYLAEIFASSTPLPINDKITTLVEKVKNWAMNELIV
jgi:energy-coupling factor transporter ATP-binding protein EcfA2